MKTVTLHLADAQHARLATIADLLNTDLDSLILTQALAHVDMWGNSSSDLVCAFQADHAKYVVQGMHGNPTGCTASVALSALRKEVKKRGGLTDRKRSLETAEASIEVTMTAEQAAPIHELAADLRATPSEMVQALALAMLDNGTENPAEEYSRMLLDFVIQKRRPAPMEKPLWIHSYGEEIMKEGN